MEVWQEIAKNAERGAERLVAEQGDRLNAAVLWTLAQAVGDMRRIRKDVVRPWKVGPRALHDRSGRARLLVCSTAESMSEFFKTVK